jgi:hypothetical protein
VYAGVRTVHEMHTNLPFFFSIARPLQPLGDRDVAGHAGAGASTAGSPPRHRTDAVLMGGSGGGLGTLGVARGGASFLSGFRGL